MDSSNSRFLLSNSRFLLSNSRFLLSVNHLIIKLFVALAFAPHVFGCFTSIFNFGDSLSDTGNLKFLCFSDKPPHFCFPPYGDTFFHQPTGRCSNGRLILDFLAESLGLPLVQPYLKRENITVKDFQMGLNFAVSGATALDASFFSERGISSPRENVSLAVEVEWFNKTFSSFCRTFPKCREILGSSLIMMGEIGGNDYNHPFFEQRSFEEIKSFVPLVIKTIASAISDLIEMGGKTIVVPGNLPIGCSTAYLRIYKTEEKGQYDPQNGCLKWLNEFAEYHNEQLQKQLKRLRARYPGVNIIYADYYNAAMRFYNTPRAFGFTNALGACCVGASGAFNTPKDCGLPSTRVCDEPWKYVSWDGEHLTEAAYKLIANDLLEGPYTNPRIKASCISQNSRRRY